ncbi:MAG TPA: hypothetical protein VMS99_17940 [Acidimicrobiia bacterium]|nr:hypothetical protein [Acidimicrobiia bacterium]
MTENSQDRAEESSDRSRWVDEVQEAFDRTGEAIRTAWDATRESRMSALEAAKQAASELSDVIDQGIAAARERWAASESPGGDATADETSEEANPGHEPQDH